MNCVIGEMHISVGAVLETKLAAAGPEVALSVPVALQVAIDGAHKGEAADVELPALVQERLLDVLLDYVTPFDAVDIRIGHQTLYLVQITAHLDAKASVGVLSRLDDPEVPPELGKRG